MNPPMPSTTLCVTINRPWPAVYAFASNPRNLPQWAPGVSNEAFAADARLVEQDLHTLKRLLEADAGG